MPRIRAFQPVQTRLTNRLVEVVCMSASGLSDRQIALREGVSADTVESHWRRLRCIYDLGAKPAIVNRTLGVVRARVYSSVADLRADDVELVASEDLFTRRFPSHRTVDFDGLAPRGDWKHFWLGLNLDECSLYGLGKDRDRLTCHDVKYFAATGVRSPSVARQYMAFDRPFGRGLLDAGVQIRFAKERCCVGVRFRSSFANGWNVLPDSSMFSFDRAHVEEPWQFFVRTDFGWSRFACWSQENRTAFAGFSGSTPIRELIARPGELSHGEIDSVLLA